MGSVVHPFAGHDSCCYRVVGGRDGRSPVTNLGDPDAINCYRSVTGRAKQARPQDATSSSAFQSAL
jgi:hypothetical protein